MSFNLTAAFLEARMSPLLLPFAKQVATSSGFLDGAGAVGADGIPCPWPGKITGLSVWDGTTLHTTDSTHTLSAGDRVSLFATYASGTFNLTVIVNGNFTSVQVTGVAANATLQASVPLLLARS